MGIIAGANSPVTIEETRVQAAPTEDLIGKLGADHTYLHDQFTNVLPANDTTIQSGVNSIVSRNANIKLTHVKDLDYSGNPGGEAPLWFMEYDGTSTTWTAIVMMCPHGSDFAASFGTRKVIEENIPLGSPRCFFLGLLPGQGVRVWRADIV